MVHRASGISEQRMYSLAEKKGQQDSFESRDTATFSGIRRAATPNQPEGSYSRHMLSACQGEDCHHDWVLADPCVKLAVQGKRLFAGNGFSESEDKLANRRPQVHVHRPS